MLTISTESHNGETYYTASLGPLRARPMRSETKALLELARDFPIQLARHAIALQLRHVDRERAHDAERQAWRASGVAELQAEVAHLRARLAELEEGWRP